MHEAERIYVLLCWCEAPSYQRVVAAGHADVAPGQEGAGQAVT